MKDIEIGEYVRTKDGYLGSFVEYIPKALNYLKIDIGRPVQRMAGITDNFIYTRHGFLLKHSKDIMDLIEIGDVLEISEFREYFRKTNKIPIFDRQTIVTIREGIIKGNLKVVTVLTKEQYEDNCYRIGEK